MLRNSNLDLVMISRQILKFQEITRLNYSKNSKYRRILAFKDDKTLYGEVIKSKKSKTQQEESAKNSVTEELSSTEAKWSLRTSHVTRLRIKSREGENTSEKKIVNGNNNGSDNKSSNNQNYSSIVESEDSKVKVPQLPEKSQLLSNIIVKNIFTFPFIDKTAKSDTTESTSTLSIKAQQDANQTHLPSVSKILNATMPESARKALEIWKNRLIKELGQEGFDRYSKKILQDGRQLHLCIQNNLLGKDYTIPSTIEPLYQSVESTLKEVTDIKAIESHVVHSKLHYRGILDCIGYYRGHLCLIDWKRSEKMKDTVDSTYDAPIQIAAYMGAVNSSKNYSFTVSKGLVVVAYTSGEPATIHELNIEQLQKYWKKWLAKLQEYNTHINQNISYS